MVIVFLASLLLLVFFYFLTPFPYLSASPYFRVVKGGLKKNNIFFNVDFRSQDSVRTRPESLADSFLPSGKRKPMGTKPFYPLC